MRTPKDFKHLKPADPMTEEKILLVTRMSLSDSPERMMELLDSFLQSFASQYKEELSRLKGGWISVKDRLPGKFKNVLVISDKGRIRITCVDASGKLDEFEQVKGLIDKKDDDKKWTHWQPLPPAPDSKIEPSQSGNSESKFLLIDVFADNGEHSHWALIESATGVKVWSEDPAECKAQGHPVRESGNSESVKLTEEKPDFNNFIKDDCQ
jgi:hypothetical protein